MDILSATTSFAALSQETRLHVFRLLITAGETGLTSGEIGEQLGVKQNTMSQNLSVLLNAGLVRNQREGRRVRYFANYAGIQGLITFLMEDCCGGNTALCQPILDKMSC